MFKEVILIGTMLNKVIKSVEAHLSEKTNEIVKVVSFCKLGGGCINNALKLETNIGLFFLKWNNTGRTDMFLREAEGLKELGKASAGILKIPEVFCAKDVDSTPGFLVQEYLEPQIATDIDDEKLGRGLALIHEYTNNKFGFRNNNYCGATEQNNNWESDWSVFFVENRLRFLLTLIQNKRPFSYSEQEMFDKLLMKIPDLIPKESCPVLIHGDLWSGNYMSTKQGPALIDPAVYYADREMEFAIITMFGGFSQKFYNAYNEVNPLAKDWRSRNSLYQLYHVLNHYYLFGGGYGSQALSIAQQFV